MKIVTRGARVLAEAARPYARGEIASGETARFVRSLRALMHEEGGMGIAAPQVGVGRRLVLVEYEGDGEAISEVPFTAMFNPVLRVEESVGSGGSGGSTIDMWESCLSIPGKIGRVRRYSRCTVEFTDVNGNECAVRASGYLAGLLQHEIDHVEGTLYTERMQPGDVLYDEDVWQRTSTEALCSDGKLEWSRGRPLPGGGSEDMLDKRFAGDDDIATNTGGGGGGGGRGAKIARSAGVTSTPAADKAAPTRLFSSSRQLRSGGSHHDGSDTGTEPVFPTLSKEDLTAILTAFERIFDVHAAELAEIAAMPDATPAEVHRKYDCCVRALQPLRFQALVSHGFPPTMAAYRNFNEQFSTLPLTAEEAATLPHPMAAMARRMFGVEHITEQPDAATTAIVDALTRRLQSDETTAALAAIVDELEDAATMLSPAERVSCAKSCLSTLVNECTFAAIAECSGGAGAGKHAFFAHQVAMPRWSRDERHAASLAAVQAEFGRCMASVMHAIDE